VTISRVLYWAIIYPGHPLPDGSSDRGALRRAAGKSPHLAPGGVCSAGKLPAPRV